MLSEEEIDLVQESWARVRVLGLDPVGKLFYDTLFAESPALRTTLFVGVNMEEQRNKLLTGLLSTSVRWLKHPDKLIPALRASGVRHAGYGCEEGQYPIVLTALAKTLTAGLGDEFTPAVKAAWVKTYAIMSAAMIEGQTSPEGRRRREQLLVQQKVQAKYDTRLVQETWEQARQVGLEAIGRHFLELLFRDHPELRSTLFFSTDPTALGAVVARFLDGVVRLTERPSEEIPAMMRASGVRHAGYGVEAKHYPHVCEALVGTLAAALGDTFTTAARYAWIRFYGLLQTAMLEGHDSPDGQRKAQEYARRHGITTTGAGDDSPSATARTVGCRVVSVEQLTPQLRCVTLCTDGATPLPATPGAYIGVQVGGRQDRCTPFAVAPNGTFRVFGRQSGKGITNAPFAASTGDAVVVSLPPPRISLGALLQAPDVLFLGAGTPSIALAEMAAALVLGGGARAPPVSLLWCFGTTAEAASTVGWHPTTRFGITASGLTSPVNKGPVGARVRRGWVLSREVSAAAVRPRMAFAASDAIYTSTRLTEAFLRDFIGPKMPARAVIAGPAGFNVVAYQLLVDVLKMRDGEVLVL